MVTKSGIVFPDLIEFNNYGNYDRYEEALLKVYEADLWKGRLTFNGFNVIPRIHKKFELNGKTLDWTFAHFTSKGEIDEDRELDLKRCERIGYVNPIIKNAHLDCVKVWENDRFDKMGRVITSVVLWCEEVSSKVVLTKVKGKKNEYYVITTFYLISSLKKIQSLTQEYNEYVKKNGLYVVTP